MELLYVSARLPLYTVGRDKGCDLVIPDPFISRIHLQFEPLTPDVARLTVCGSNGAVVKGIHVCKGYRCHVRAGDRVQIGKKVLVWIGDRYERGDYIKCPPHKPYPEPGTVEIEAPPPRKIPEKPSLMLAVGPALTMALPVLLGAGRSIAVLSSVFAAAWAAANVLARVRRSRMDERRRRSSYLAYLSECEEQIRSGIRQAADSLESRNPPISSIFREGGDPFTLWSGRAAGDGSISVRIGTGRITNPLCIAVPKERFAQIDDSLREMPNDLVKKYEYICPAPVLVPIEAGNISGVRLEGEKDRRVFAAILLRIAATYSPDSMSITVRANKNTMRYYMWTAVLPHYRSDYADDKEGTFRLVVTDSAKEALDRTAFSDMVILVRYDDDFPAGVGAVINRDMGGREVRYDVLSPELCWSYAGRMSELWGMGEADHKLPDVVPFGTLFPELSAGDTEACVRGVIRNYGNNDITTGIGAPVGMTEGKEKLVLDLHERSAGSHGLIAGTTGSGKSELLTTLILSLAVRFPPDKAAFFLIDYKGGGMSNLFADLPHLIGSISNLSKSESKRAEISLKSENIRRQRIFAEEGVNNINDYTRLYDAGKVTRPLPHVFIIVDEFAELRREEPDFMDRLISVSQVGRSLGMHLILATQKPAGVVDDRIRANSGFRIALRLVDRADSMDMLRREDAVTLKERGRAYLQVGNDEIFSCFQSGYAMCAAADSVERPRIFDDFWLEEEVTCTGQYDKEGSGGSNTWLDVALVAIRAAVERLDIPPCARLYLPPLPPECADDSAYALYDNPYMQSYEKAVFDPEQTGHILITGKGGSGKSELIHTLIERLGANASVYIIDFGGGRLRDQAHRKRCGGYVPEGDNDDAVRLLLFIDGMLSGRRKKETKDVEPPVVLVLDDCNAIEKASEDVYELLAGILTGGRMAGITVIASSGQMPPGKVSRLFDTYLFLGEEDPYMISQYLKVPSRDIPAIKGMPGRGVGLWDGMPLEFQTVITADHEGGSGPCEVEAAAYPHVPQHVTLEELLGGAKKQGIRGIPVGYEHRSGRICLLPFGKVNCALIYGRTYSGRHTLMANIKAAAENAGITCTGATSYAELTEAFRHAAGPLIVTIESMTAVLDDYYSTDRDAAEEEELISYLANPVGVTKDCSRRMTVGIIDNEARIRFAGRKVFEELCRHIYGISLGGNLDENRIFDFSYMPFSQMQKSQCRGCATVLKFDDEQYFGDIVFPAGK